MTTTQTYVLDLTGKGLSYRRETTPWVTPDPGAPTAMNFFGPSSTIRLTHTESPRAIPEVGNEDVRDIKGGIQLQTIGFDTCMYQSTEAKLGINAQGGGAGTIDDTNFILAGVKIAGGATVTYFEANGTRTNRIALSGRMGMEHQIGYELYGKVVEPWPTALPTNLTEAVDPGTTAWGFEDGGATPITWNAVGADVIGLDVTINRNLLRRGQMGARSIVTNRPGPRHIIGTLEVGWADQSLWNDMIGSTYRTLAWILKTATSTLTASNCKIYGGTDPIDWGKGATPFEITQQLIIGAKSCVIT